MAKKPKAKVCSICKGKYIGYGHNADPYAGRCCDSCNMNAVIPARVYQMATGDYRSSKEWANYYRKLCKEEVA